MQNCAFVPRFRALVRGKILTARNTEEAAKTVGVSLTTLLRWKKLPEFERAYREARRAAFGQAITRL